jgi:hypothetical protein
MFVVDDLNFSRFSWCVEMNLARTDPLRHHVIYFVTDLMFTNL